MKIEKMEDLKIKEVEELKGYFEKKDNVALAFLFGSRVCNRDSRRSDWDIAVYFKPYQYIETETREHYEGEEDISIELCKMLKTDNIDIAILNRIAPSIVFSVLRKGMPLKMNKGLYLDLLCKVSYDAIDFREFALDFYRISKRANSIEPDEKIRLIRVLTFLKNEFKEIEEIKKITYQEYMNNSFKRKIIERWVENLVMSSLDIAKIVLASFKKEIPQSYGEILEMFGLLYFNEEFAKRFSSFAPLRNIIVHQYLDINWMRIKDFIKEGEELYPMFIKKVEEVCEL